MPTDLDQTSFLGSHVTGAADHLRNDSAELRQVSPEQELYDGYVRAGSPHGPVLYAVKGEHWNGVSPQFLEFLNNYRFRREDMGYAECGYGIQRHRDFLRGLIVDEHHLHEREPRPGTGVDVGCLAMTTRMAMYDLAKIAYAHSCRTQPGRTPVALVPTPGWDYRGIFRDVGFTVVYLPIRPGARWLPDMREWADIVAGIDPATHHVAVAVSNPQHNPTGMQWPTDITRFLLRLCAERSGYLLLDDAYYGVHDPRVPVVNHLKAVLAEFDGPGGERLVAGGMFDRWVATRPFGKQFSCNTMGVAAITTSPVLLRQLNRESWINRYHTNTHNAEVMCAWLATPEAREWTLQTGLFYARQKDLVRRRLTERMNWPSEAVCVGPSTSYMLFEIPRVYQDADGGIDRFRDDLFHATGTLICASLFNQAAPAPYVRLHLGSHYDVLEEFLRRWEEAGLRYDQPEPFLGEKAMTEPLPPRVWRREAL